MNTPFFQRVPPAMCLVLAMVSATVGRAQTAPAPVSAAQVSAESAGKIAARMKQAAAPAATRATDWEARQDERRAAALQIAQGDNVLTTLTRLKTNLTANLAGRSAKGNTGNSAAATTVQAEDAMSVGLTLLSLHKPEAAEACLQKAAALFGEAAAGLTGKDRAAALFQAAYLQSNYLNAKPAAQQNLESAAELDPQNTSVKNLLLKIKATEETQPAKTQEGGRS